jgi:hypothetical protein
MKRLIASLLLIAGVASAQHVTPVRYAGYAKGADIPVQVNGGTGTLAVTISSGTLSSTSTVVDGNGLVSTNNSSTAALAGGAVFTGVADDVSEYATITLFVDTDTDGQVRMELSTDGSNWDRAKVFPIDQSIGNGSVHTLEVVSQYYRVVVSNDWDSATQGHLRLQSIYHKNRSSFLTASSGQRLSKIDDVQLTRVVNHHELDVSRGLYADSFSVRKFAAINSPSSTNFMWNNTSQTEYHWLATNTQLYVNSDSVSDSNAASGCRSVVLAGLGPGWAQADETVTLSGTNGVQTTGTFWRVHRLYCDEVGTYGGINAGSLAAGVAPNPASASTGTVAFVLAGVGQSEQSNYSVPAGYTAYLVKLNSGVDGSANKTADIRLWRRLSGNNIASPKSLREVADFRALNGSRNLDFRALPAFGAYTDLFVDTGVVAGSPASADVEYELILKEGDTPTNPQ